MSPTASSTNGKKCPVTKTAWRASTIAESRPWKVTSFFLTSLSGNYPLGVNTFNSAYDSSDIQNLVDPSHINQKESRNLGKALATESLVAQN